MTWFAWRQFRTSAWTTAAALAAFAVLLALTGHQLAQMWSDSGAATCHDHCAEAISTFLGRAGAGAPDTVYNAGLAVLYAVPALIGMLWGAPLIARELEAGTHRLAWNQSVTRTRWLAGKLAVGGAASAATAGLLSWAVTAWAHHLDRASDNRIKPLVYGARGVVPVGYALFAFALGVTLGMLIRRTVPAMVATLAIYVAAVVSMPLAVRAHLVPAVRLNGPLDLSRVAQFRMQEPSGRMDVVSGVVPKGAWVLTNQTISPDGSLFTGPGDPQHCGPAAPPHECLDWAGTLGLRQHLVYQPDSHFWALQWTEAGIFVAAALLLAGFCFAWTRRRLA